MIAGFACGNGFAESVSTAKRQTTALATNGNSTSSSLNDNSTSHPVFDPKDNNSWSFERKVKEFATLNRKYADLVEVLLASGVSVKFYDELHEDFFKEHGIGKTTFLNGNVFIHQLGNSREHEAVVRRMERIFGRYSDSYGDTILSTGSADVKLGEKERRQPDGSFQARGKKMPNNEEADTFSSVVFEVMIHHVEPFLDVGNRYIRPDNSICYVFIIRIYEEREGGTPMVAVGYSRTENGKPRRCASISFGTVALDEADSSEFGALIGVGASKDSDEYLFLSIAPKYLYFHADQPEGAGELRIDLKELRSVYHEVAHK